LRDTICAFPSFIIPRKQQLKRDAIRKHAINTDEMLDFLKEIVQNVPDPTNGGTIAEGSGKKQRKPRAPNGSGPKPRGKKSKMEVEDDAGQSSAPLASASTSTSAAERMDDEDDEEDDDDDSY
jgi:Dr1-associated corepressor